MNKTKRKDLIYDGKAKKIFSCQDDNLVIQYFKDDTTANNAQKHSIISGKGVINNRISEYLMQSIEKIGIPTHFVERLNMREQLVKKVEIIPIEFVVRNISAGSISKKFNIPEGKVFNQPIIEYYLKNDGLGDPMMCESHLIRLGYIKSDELDEIIDFSFRINDFLQGLFLGIGIRLVDFKLEFGRHRKNESFDIILADEISPDNCRLWNKEDNKKLDKDRFRQDLGEIKEVYQEVAKRLGVLNEEK